MSTRRQAQNGAIIAMALAGVLALSGCIGAAEASGPSSVARPVASGPAASGLSPSSDVRTFYDQKLTWASCNTEGFDCTSVVAPIDWAKPATGTMKLAVVRFKTSGAKVGSLLINPGGPGGSGYDTVAESVQFVTDATVRKNFDVVGWDPRGVGKSQAVTCFDRAGQDAYLYSTPTSVEGSDAWLADQVPKAKAFAAACAKNTGALLGHIDAESNARDMDLLRAVLGDKKLNYLGFSYGTFFGAHYARLFAKNVGRLVLDGPVDPAIGEAQDFVTQMAGFESAYRAYLADCLTGTRCPFGGTLSEALSQSKTLFDGVAALALKNKDGRQLTAGVLGTALSYPLYSQAQWPALTTMITALQAGNAGPTFAQADGYNGRGSDGSYSADSNVYIGALCLDGVYPATLDGTRTTMNAIATAAPTVGAVLSYSDWVQVSVACQNWPYKPVLSEGPIAAKGAAPIMVVGTTNDPATPYANAIALSHELESGILVTRNGQGHTAYGSGNACIDRTVDAYLVKGTVPASDPLC